MKIPPLLHQISNSFRQFIPSALRRLFLAIVLSSCLIILSGCQASAPKDDGVIRLTLWQGINPPANRDVFQKLVDKFNQTHTDIQVESIFAGGLDQQLPKILAAVVGNVPPDILSFYPQLTGQFRELDAIRPLEDWLDKLPLKSEVSPNLLAALTLDDHLWSVPLYTSNIGIFYRPQLFQAAGITETPKTWSELREVAKKLTIDKNGDGKPEQHGMLLPLGKGEWTVFSWFPFLWSAGGEIITDNRPNLNTEAAVTALQFWQDLIKDGSVKLSPPERGYEEDDFIAGRVAMQITGPWTYIMKSNVDYQVFPMPASVEQATVIGDGNFYVMKTNPAREKAALKFLEFVLSEEFQTEWSIGTGFLPVNIKSAQSAAYQKFMNQKPVLKVFLDQMPVARGRPIIAGYNSLSDSLGRAIEATLLGESPEKALKTAQDRLELIWHQN
ncbi:ABC transporter substrate-binding protein [Nodularia spumigena CS-584]|jgi:multiple sugar transport system substrate-binding protein|uniref:ABC transporter substrate-binding protein n=1 Tax=Nodularia spumigena UHCC 0060 TaxID=3110300 RepID=A0ABU5UVI0_NODSP|nr:ABC transporter substrate-binding protein [Nodularia spumigena]AHJ26919.1 N-Acetyl-D-glucosamine ABC transport system, sugar-binding protein [Nodularia spumigena CCY9414]EAW44462.1 extracellular solute-binding protein, family 1 [Nodularia spumigena CCY9414]MDB9380778.1 ABC transporter substrate-binding protein [Nodularia spumigena CS-584]MEA5526881.1 ABC transporter substrate-binding protein [Nodularia spumigena UHCC 0143]MEA5610292.1 ABC transporter substrate-binding protein [Nodularia spu